MVDNQKRKDCDITCKSQQVGLRLEMESQIMQRQNEGELAG